MCSKCFFLRNSFQTNSRLSGFYVASEQIEQHFLSRWRANEKLVGGWFALARFIYLLPGFLRKGGVRWMRKNPIYGVDRHATNMTRWWFQIFFMFTPTWGNDPIWLIFFQRGWNHQLDEQWQKSLWFVLSYMRWTSAQFFFGIIHDQPTSIRSCRKWVKPGAFLSNTKPVISPPQWEERFTGFKIPDNNK